MYDTLEPIAAALENQSRQFAMHGVGTNFDRDSRLERLTAELAAAKRAENAAVAAQDALIAQIAALEEVVCEDGTVVEVSRVLGSARLDAAALISDSLGVSDPVAGRRLTRALWLATQGRPVWDAMASGRIDDFRATIIHEEVVDASAEGTELLLSRLTDRLGEETAGLLRRRVRRMLTGIEPEAVKRRAEKARQGRSLQRWIGEPGMDRWLADLPADQAGPAFHAIDVRAHERLNEGLSPSIDAPRADALLELILGHCVGTVGVQFAVPITVLLQAAVSETEAAVMDPADLISVDGLSATGPVHLRRTNLSDLLDTLTEALSGPTGTHEPLSRRLVGCDPFTGAAATIPLDPDSQRRRIANPQLTSTAHDPPAALKALVRARDGHCRFPGCAASIRMCDIDHVKAWPAGPTALHNLICLCRRHHRIKQLPGWRARLLPDGRVVWTDPTNRERTTYPVDHLHLDHIGAGRIALPRNETEDEAAVGKLAEPSGKLPAWSDRDQFSLLEHHIEHVLAEAEAITKAAAEETASATKATRQGHRTSLGAEDDPPPF